MNEVKKKAIWDQWQQGHPMSVIARSVHKPPATENAAIFGAKARGARRDIQWRGRWLALERKDQKNCPAVPRPSIANWVAVAALIDIVPLEPS
mgnify:FL=1